MPIFLHLFGRHPHDMTYRDFLGCRQFADEWIKNQREGS